MAAKAAKQAISKARDGYRTQNIQAARLVLADIARYGDGGLAQWARAVLKPAADTPVEVVTDQEKRWKRK